MDAFLTPREAAKHIGFSTSTMAKWRCRGDGPAYSLIHKRVRYSRRALDDFIADHTRMSTSEAA